jgi:hypothetical protein
MASERALEIARTILKEHKVGKFSRFCDEAPDFDPILDVDLATLIDKALAAYESSPEWARERLAKIKARMKNASPPLFPPVPVKDDIDLFRRTDAQKVSTLHCDCGETFTWAGADPSVDAWILAHKSHLKTVSPTTKTARFERSAVAAPCSCSEAPGQHIHTPAGIMNYKAER